MAVLAPYYETTSTFIIFGRTQNYSWTELQIKIDFQQEDKMKLPIAAVIMRLQ